MAAALSDRDMVHRDRDDLMHQFGVFLANGYMIFIVNASEFQPEAINTAYTARFSSAMLDHGTMGLIEGLRE